MRAGKRKISAKVNGWRKSEVTARAVPPATPAVATVLVTTFPTGSSMILRDASRVCLIPGSVVKVVMPLTSGSATNCVRVGTPARGARMRFVNEDDSPPPDTGSVGISPPCGAESGEGGGVSPGVGGTGSLEVPVGAGGSGVGVGVTGVVTTGGGGATAPGVEVA